MDHSSRLSPFLSLVLCGLFIVSAACAPAAPTTPTQAATAAPTEAQPAATATTAPPKPAPTATQPIPTLSPTATQPIPQPPAATVEGSFPFGNFTNEKLGIRLSFLADGNFLFHVPPFGSYSGGTDTGTNTLAGDQITIELVSDCPGVKGTYSWTYDGKALNFKSLGDKCAEREFQMEIGPYVKEP